MVDVNVETVMQWESLIATLIPLGVQSFTAIRGLMQDAGADEATIAALEPKWAALRADVARAAGQL